MSIKWELKNNLVVFHVSGQLGREEYKKFSVKLNL